MSSREREIIDGSPDEVDQFNDLIGGFGTRDISGRPLGDVLGHSLARLKTCYSILEATSLAAESVRQELGAFDPKLSLIPAGAGVQDRRNTEEFPAAHLAPCNLIVSQSTLLQAGIPLYQVYGDGIARGFVQSIFAETQIVHVLTNRTDTLCEGMRRRDRLGTTHVLADCCNLILRDASAIPKAIFFDELLPKFRNVAAQRLIQAENALSSGFHNLEAISPLLNAQGELYAPPPRPASYNKSSSSPADRRTNLQAVIQILQTYSATKSPKLAEIAFIGQQYDALRSNERSYGRGR